VIIGVPREIKSGEQRVALTPPGARALVEGKHRVIVERGAGLGSSIRDEEYTREGATLASVEEVWGQAELILKVKEPVRDEYARMRPGQILFTYLHLAPAPELGRALQAAQVIAIAYETVQRPDGTLPLALIHISEPTRHLRIGVAVVVL
jgi:alanine dehydrogenase